MTKPKPGARTYVRKRPGDRFGALVLIENLGRINGNGYWLARCDCGNQVRVQPGQLAKTRSCGKGVHHPHYQEQPSYQRIHTRLAEQRGPARDAGPCVSCGAEAREWSYDGTDSDHLHHPRGWPYSLDLARYVPRCTKCHRRHDRHDNIRPACGLCNSITGGAVRGPLTSKKGKTVPRIRRGGNHRKSARFTNGRPATVVDRKVSGCSECGARPGGTCYTLVSVRQVNERREGAYLKPMAKLHASRGRVS